MTCSQFDCTNGGSRYIVGVGALRTLTVLCSECAAGYRLMGMPLRPEPLVIETKPRWIGRLTSRDETGWVIGPGAA